MWTSCDPAGQFWSAYSYGGNGFNPINSIDPDGNTVILSDDGSYKYIFDGKGFDIGAYAYDYETNGDAFFPLKVDYTNMADINTEIDNMQGFFKSEIGNNVLNMLGPGFVNLATAGADTRFAESTQIPDRQKTHYLVTDQSKWFKSNELNYIGIGALYKVNPLVLRIGMIVDIKLWKFTQWNSSKPSTGTIYWANYGYNYVPKN